MKKQQETSVLSPEIPEQPPFGLLVITGKKGVGKTLTCLNSPWLPVHMIDTENSSLEYHMHQQKLIEKGFFPAPFTRAECVEPDSIQQEIYRIVGRDPKDPGKKIGDGAFYGTIAIDTCGQWSDWIASVEHSKKGADKIGQIVWGNIRSRLRRALLELGTHCNCLLLTAHEREYKDQISPRCNPAIGEIAAISIRLTRAPNSKLPSAEFLATRIPFFPPRIPNFTVATLLPFFGDPADWEHLAEDQLIPEDMPLIPEEPPD